jgi:transcriptional regulator with XRE-family HTH domain
MKIREYLKKRHILMKDFADVIGISQELFYQIMRGERSLNKKYWKKIVDLTGNAVTFKDIFEGEKK